MALLKGVRLSDLERLILNIPYTPGVERLVYILKTLGYKIGIVSGGFTRVIDHIKRRFDLDYGFANTGSEKRRINLGYLRKYPR